MNLNLKYYRYQKVVHYLFFNYIEFSVFALLSLYFSSVASSDELSKSSITYLIISYSAFASLGIFSAVIKESSISGVRQEHVNYIVRFSSLYMIKLIFISSIISFLVWLDVFSYSDKQNYYVFFGILIGSLNLLKNYCKTYYRVYCLDRELNATNLSWVMVFSTMFLILYFIFNVNVVISFFGGWLIGLLVIYGIATISIFYRVFKEKKIKVFSKNKIFFSSLYLFINSINITVILTSDRLFLNLLGFNSEIIAKFQFSDTITNIFFLGFSSVIYYLTPNMINKFSNSEENKVFNRWLFQLSKFILVIGLSFFVIVFIYLNLLGRVDYQQVIIVFLHVVFKSLLIMFGVYVMFFHSVGKEYLCTKVYIFMTVSIIIFTYVFQKVSLAFVGAEIFTAIVPIFIISSICFHLFFYIKKSYILS